MPRRMQGIPQLEKAIHRSKRGKTDRGYNKLYLPKKSTCQKRTSLRRVNMFKKMKGINVPYNKQGDIYFTCVNFDSKPKKVQNKICYLCNKVAKEHSNALFAMLTEVDRKNVHAISMQHYISERQLYYYRKKFYESW